MINKLLALLRRLWPWCDTEEDEWHHVVCTYDGSTDREPKIYVNGRLEGEELPEDAVEYWEGREG